MGRNLHMSTRLTYSLAVETSAFTKHLPAHLSDDLTPGELAAWRRVVEEIEHE